MTMSTNLHWRPLNADQTLDAKPDRLKLILREKFGFSSPREPLRVDESLIVFLEGLDAAGVHGAKNLIKLIRKYGEIELYEAE